MITEPSRILFLQMAEKSYDEIFFIDRLTQQWSDLYPEVEVYALVNGLCNHFVSSRAERIVGVLTENQSENRKRFETLNEAVAFDAIFILDLHEYFIHPMDLNFLPLWLKNQKCPLYALDYYNLMVYNKNLLYLRTQVNLDKFEEGEAPLPLDITVELLKPCLPNQSQVLKTEINTWPLQSSFTEHTIGSAQSRQELLNSVEAKEKDHIISIFFDPLLYTQSAERSLIGYYFVLIEVLIFYLRQMRGEQFQIFIVGSMPPSSEVNLSPDLNVNLHYISHLTEDNYAAFLSASDLIITNNDWSVALLDALGRSIPVCLFGNSIIEEWTDNTETEKELRASFQPLKPLYNFCLLMVELNQFSLSMPIFQFISYPLRLEGDFPDAGLRNQTYPYFLFDMFDDEATLPMLKQVLLSSETRKKYKTLCEDYKKQSTESLTLGQIHTQRLNQNQEES
jgi:hypothetical protein